VHLRADSAVAIAAALGGWSSGCTMVHFNEFLCDEKLIFEQKWILKITFLLKISLN
jgi:hypothetical protein